MNGSTAFLVFLQQAAKPDDAPGLDDEVYGQVTSAVDAVLARSGSAG
jgi:hypothetical protein